MKAHKVPVTYLAGWKAQGFKSSFYVFYKHNLEKRGIRKNYKKFKNYQEIFVLWLLSM